MARWKSVGYTAVIISLLTLFTGCAAGKDVMPDLRESVREKVDTAVAECGELHNIECFDAVTVPKITKVVIENNSVLEKLHVTIGDTVKEGELLASLTKGGDNPVQILPEASGDSDYNRKLLQIELEIAKAQMALYNSRNSLSETEEKERKLLKLDILTLESELKAFGEPVTGEKEDVSDSEAVLKTEDDQPVTIKAPCGGTIVYRTVAVKGDSIPAGSVIFCIARAETVIRCEYIPSSVLESADRVYATANGAEIDIKEDTSKENTELYASGTDKNTIFLPADTGNKLTAGRYVPVYVISQTKKDAVHIPVDAVKTDKDGYYVYVMNNEKRELRRVQTGMSTVSNIEIVSGIEKGDIVLVTE